MEFVVVGCCRKLSDRYVWSVFWDMGYIGWVAYMTSCSISVCKKLLVHSGTSRQMCVVIVRSSNCCGTKVLVTKIFQVKLPDLTVYV